MRTSSLLWALLLTAAAQDFRFRGAQPLRATSLEALGAVTACDAGAVTIEFDPQSFEWLKTNLGSVAGRLLEAGRARR